LFSHPANFTPVCTTELGAVARLQQQFQRRNAKVIALSTDLLKDHFRWVEDIEETQDVQLNFPIIADEDGKIAELYEMIQPGISEKTTVRSVFIIGPDKQIKLTLTYPPSTGRNFEEILRVLDSLQLTADQYVATPSDWQQGDDVVVLPSISDENAAKLFPRGIRRVKPYLRYTPQPDL
jgi:thioredoxin-dependent peroxiredoxin